MRISILGDSISKGVVFDGPSNRYSQLKKNYVSILEEKFGFSVDNYSKFGCTVTKGLAMLEHHKDKVAGSQYAVLEYGGNDSDFKWQEVSDKPDDIHYPLTPMEDFKRGYIKMIDEIRALGATPILLNLPPIDANRYFERITQGKNPASILRYLGGDVHYIYRWHESYNIVISKIAYDKHVTMIDIRTAFLLDRNGGDLICSDGIHPSEAGHSLIAKSIEAGLKAS